MPDYAINVFWSDEDGQWIAETPDLKGCSASGDTPDEAVREMQIAKQLWLDVARQDNEEIPQPRYRPAPSPR
jgi:predicted RNase H-like HicB family nuclease